MKKLGILGLFLIGLSPLSAFAMCEVVTTSTTYGLGTVLSGTVCGMTGGQFVELRTLLSGENQTLNEIYTSESGVPVQYTSTGDKNVKAAPGEIVGLLAASGTSVTAVIYDDADGTCSSGVLSGTLSLTNGTFLRFPSRHATGICITIGGTSPNVTVFYK